MILLVLPQIADPLQASELGLVSTSLSLTMALFFVPATLLGVVAPVLTRLASTTL